VSRTFLVVLSSLLFVQFLKATENLDLRLTNKDFQP